MNAALCSELSMKSCKWKKERREDVHVGLGWDMNLCHLEWQLTTTPFSISPYLFSHWSRSIQLALLNRLQSVFVSITKYCLTYNHCTCFVWAHPANIDFFFQSGPNCWSALILISICTSMLRRLSDIGGDQKLIFPSQWYLQMLQ